MRFPFEVAPLDKAAASEFSSQLCYPREVWEEIRTQQCDPICLARSLSAQWHRCASEKREYYKYDGDVSRHFTTSRRQTRSSIAGGGDDSDEPSAPLL